MPRSKGFDDDISEMKKFRMCTRKRKYKSNRASRVASRFGHRKYQCPICDGWHLTKKKEAA